MQVWGNQPISVPYREEMVALVGITAVMLSSPMELLLLHSCETLTGSPTDFERCSK